MDVTKKTALRGVFLWSIAETQQVLQSLNPLNRFKFDASSEPDTVSPNP